VKRNPLRRSTPLRAHSRLDRHTPVKRVNRARKTKAWLRAFGSVERVNWIAGRECVACGYGRNCENHHVVSGGKSRRADARFVVPLCWVCHRELHTIGREAFQAYYEIDLLSLAAETERAWQAFNSTPSSSE